MNLKFETIVQLQSTFLKGTNEFYPNKKPKGLKQVANLT